MTVEGNVSRQKPHHSSTDSDHKIVAGTRPVFFFCGFGLPPDCTSYRVIPYPCWYLFVPTR